jgi:CheY-like chemotaxis protein
MLCGFLRIVLVFYQEFSLETKLNQRVDTKVALRSSITDSRNGEAKPSYYSHNSTYVRIVLLTWNEGGRALNFNDWVRLIELFISFLQVLAWPLVIFGILFFFRQPLRNFLDSIVEVNFKAGPIETTARRDKLIELSASLGAATAHWSDVTTGEKGAPGGTPMPDIERTKKLAQTISELMTPDAAERMERATILWVDDRPANNTYERQALEALGVQITISKSTEDALDRLRRKPYDVILSDMSRPPDPQAGYTLLNKLKEMQITTPYIIYAGSKRPEHVAKAKELGAFGTTNDPQELLELVIQAVKK